MSCTLTILLAQRCLGMWGLFYNFDFNRCALYVAVSPEFRCGCPYSGAVRQIVKVAFETFGRLMQT